MNDCTILLLATLVFLKNSSVLCLYFLTLPLVRVCSLSIHKKKSGENVGVRVIYRKIRYFGQSKKRGGRVRPGNVGAPATLGGLPTQGKREKYDISRLGTLSGNCSGLADFRREQQE
jgi:hypothetical protein